MSDLALFTCFIRRALPDLAVTLGIFALVGAAYGVL